MSINSKNFAVLLSPLIDEWYDGTYKDAEAYPEVYSKVYNVSSTTQRKVTVSPIHPAGLFNEQDMDGGHTEYDEPSIGAPSTYIQHKYSKGFRITEAIRKFNETDKLKDLSTQLAQSARWTVEYNAILPLLLGWGSGDGTAVGANTFSGTTQTYTYADGCSLFHATHPIGATATVVGEEFALGSTWSNTVTGALSQTTLSTAAGLLRKQPNAIGIPDVMRAPDTLFVAPDNEIVAKQLIANTSDNTSGLNSGVKNPNAIFNIKIVVVPYFLDPGIWVLRAPLRSCYNKFLWNEKPDKTLKETDFDSDVMKVRAKMYFACGFHDARGFVGGGQS